ncbi:MAG: UbiA family prenyltransferase, partial [Alphaproteobacteria bacterium]|nr:UbiA family prenyltransferase [Alphaproteobacteria bacterium]
MLMLAGVGIVYVPAKIAPQGWEWAVVIGLLSLCLASSANYTINEAIDAKFDRYHPLKCLRSAVQNDLCLRLIILQYLAFAVTSLALAYYVQANLACIIALYLTGALLYNIAPVRLKDVAYVDVLAEASNYPLRLMVGWACIL